MLVLLPVQHAYARTDTVEHKDHVMVAVSPNAPISSTEALTDVRHYVQWHQADAADIGGRIVSPLNGGYRFRVTPITTPALTSDTKGMSPMATMCETAAQPNTPDPTTLKLPLQCTAATAAEMAGNR